MLYRALLIGSLAAASGFAVSAPARPAVSQSSSLPAVRMAAVLRTNDVVKVISGDDKVCHCARATSANTSPAVIAAGTFYSARLLVSTIFWKRLILMFCDVVRVRRARWASC